MNLPLSPIPSFLTPSPRPLISGHPHESSRPPPLVKISSLYFLSLIYILLLRIDIYFFRDFVSYNLTGITSKSFLTSISLSSQISSRLHQTFLKSFFRNLLSSPAFLTFKLRPALSSNFLNRLNCLIDLFPTASERFLLPSSIRFHARIPYVPDLNLPSSPSIALCFSKNLLPFEVFCSSTWLVPFSVLSHCLFSIPDLLSSLIPKIGSSNLMVSLENFRAPFLVPHHCPISPYPQIPPLKFFLLTPSTAYLYYFI